jgi:hypothetical protein
MATDALDAGPNGNYPYLPRNPDGTLDTDRMPIGLTYQRKPDGCVVLIDVTPALPDGRPITAIAPAPTGAA